MLKCKSIKTDIYGDTYHYNKNDQLHRENDLPAIVYANGDKYWYKNDQYHRENDLPAIVLANGNKYWYKNDRLHRENDLPAVVLADCRTEYWIEGVKIR